VRRGPDVVLSEVDMAVPRGARAVIVGPNGCGKTTLLSVVAGTEIVESGSLAVGTASLGWLRQEAVSGSSRTVYEEAVSEMEATAAGKDLEAAEAALAAAEGDPGKTGSAQQVYDAAVARFEALGGYDLERRASAVLRGLSFARGDFERPCSELSGGWQMRVALARALLRDPELLLLDEPTNHMDVSAKRWLASYLTHELPPGRTLLLVTHDKSLLEEIRCTDVVEIAARRILQYRCSSIGQWERMRAERLSGLQKQVAKLERAAEAERDYIRRWGAKASHASQAQSRKKKLAKMELEMEELRDALRGLPKDADAASADVASGTLPLASPNRVWLKLPEPPLAGSPPVDGVLLGLQGVQVGYPQGPAILRDVQVTVGTGMRMALLGPNGCGKSTLLRTLAGTLEVQDGKRRVGAGSLRRARVALFTQDLAQDLPSDQTPVEYVLGDGAPIMLDAEGARKALGALGLRSEVHNSRIGTLSGGEKARVALAVFATRPADVLLLDEPTNHLDGAAVTALSRGLREHPGAVVVASHDRAFVDDLEVTGTVLVSRGEAGEAGSIQVARGSLELDALPTTPAPDAGAPAASPTVAPTAPEAPPGQAPRAARQAANRAAREARKLMERIEGLEVELEEAQQAMNTAYTQEKYTAYESLRAEVDALYEQWEELEGQAQAFAAA